MYDGINVAGLPAGGDAVAGYVDGLYANMTALGARPQRKLGIAVFAQDDADVLDVERYDASPPEVPGWVRRQQARGLARPIVYCGAATLDAVLAAMAAGGIGRSEVRLWTAHYNNPPQLHICGPAGPYCGVSIDVDGTQWLSTGSYDQSVLRDDFFGATQPVQEDEMTVIVRNPDGSSSLAIIPGLHAPVPVSTADESQLANRSEVKPSLPFWQSVVAQLWEDTVLNQELKAAAAAMTSGHPQAPLTVVTTSTVS
jgi:hypothetical protein